ncbi:MAG: hypothetical protein DRZ82_05235 [Thermoprotei archaeon]|nr:MAG: hypothetical protein DRZ82_05235 [Thermoprotei archaeon]
MLVPVDITIDSREASIRVVRNKTIKEYLEELGLKVAVDVLPIGDYYLHAKRKEECIIIERKTITDLANSIRDGRLWNQLRALSEQKENGISVILLVEGWIKLLEKFTKWRPQAILRLLETIQVKYGIPIVYSPSWDWTALYIKARAEALGKAEEKKVYYIRAGKRPSGLHERILFVAEGLVGPKLARRLLEEFSTLRRLANASRVELMRVEGIGKERADLIWRIFNTPWRGNEKE